MVQGVGQLLDKLGLVLSFRSGSMIHIDKSESIAQCMQCVDERCGIRASTGGDNEVRLRFSELLCLNLLPNFLDEAIHVEFPPKLPGTIRPALEPDDN